MNRVIPPSNFAPILKPTFRRVDRRGTFLEALNERRWGSLLYGEMKRGAVLGNHYHKKTAVFFFLTHGAAQVQWIHPQTRKRVHRALKSQEGIFLEPPFAHAIKFLRDSSFIMLKSRRYDKARPDTYPHAVFKELRPRR